jgi:hypothetical protein
MSEPPNDSNLNDKSISNNKIDQNIVNQKLFINLNLFSSTIMSMTGRLKEKAEELINNKKVFENKIPSFNKLIKACTDIVEEYKKESETELDQPKIIKKVFYTLKDNLELLKTKSVNLFTVRNKENKITTIIPGVNISLLIEHLSEEEIKLLWLNIYVLFVTSVDMVYSNTEPSKHKKEILDTVSYCKTDLGELNSIFKNYFLGLQSDNSISLENLMSEDIVIPGTDVKGNLLTSLGVNKLMDMNNLSDEIKKFTDEDVDETISTITDMFNSGGDNDVKDVCSTMVKTVLDDLKENGLNNMFDIASRVTSKLQNKVDVTKMEKTAGLMGNFMQNSNDKIKDLKDENGNPVGGQLLSQFETMMNMAKMFKK